MKTKKIRSYLGNNTWSTPVDLGADAANVDYTKGSGQDATSVTVQDELDDLNERVEPYEFDTIAEMNAAIQAGDVREGATIFVKEGSGSESGGHTIQNPSGTSMTQRTNLKFVGASVTDDSTNDATVVDISTALDGKVDKNGTDSLMTAAEHTKLEGIEAGAEVNTVTSVAGKTGDVTIGVSDINGLGAAASRGVDTTPTDNSVNLITSGGVKEYGDEMVQISDEDPGEGAPFTGKLLVVVEE